MIHSAMQKVRGFSMLVWGDKQFWVSQKAGIFIWAVQQGLRHIVNDVYLSVINSLKFCKSSHLPVSYCTHRCKFHLLLHRNKMLPFAGRNYHYAVTQGKSMKNVQRWSMSPMRLPWEFPSWELCEENGDNINLENLTLDAPSVHFPLIGLQH